MLNSGLNTIYDEHRSLGAVVQGLLYLVGGYRRDAMEPDFTLLRSIVFYLDEFPQKLHHPKEEAYLFAKLQIRTRTADKVIAQLRHQHHAGMRYVEDLHKTLDKYEIDGSPALAAFSDAVEGFAVDILQHMALEESTLLPLASRHLTGEDWVEVGVAFGKNGDPRFVADADHAYADLFRRLINVTLPSGAGSCTGSQPADGNAPDR
ncbi:MAG: hemerythrin domain-containing protein [Rhodocyclales bacterium]|nr:hemerythrin domain-containing protein [Rhodocyclales bacterium]